MRGGRLRGRSLRERAFWRGLRTFAERTATKSATSKIASEATATYRFAGASGLDIPA